MLGKLLNGCTTSALSRRAQLHGVREEESINSQKGRNEQRGRSGE
jgi:hypothetical protein